MNENQLLKQVSRPSFDFPAFVQRLLLRKFPPGTTVQLREVRRLLGCLCRLSQGDSRLLLRDLKARGLAELGPDFVILKEVADA